MTPKELTAGRELDALVATKVIGWRWMRPPTVREPVLMPPDQWQAYTSGAIDLYTVHNCHDDPPSRLPHYSTDIAAAWEVVEKLRVGNHSESYAFELRDNSEHGKKAEWVVGFVRYDAIRDIMAYPCEWWSANTAPLAICVAALKAVES